MQSVTWVEMIREAKVTFWGHIVRWLYRKQMSVLIYSVVSVS